MQNTYYSLNYEICLFVIPDLIRNLGLNSFTGFPLSRE